MDLDPEDDRACQPDYDENGVDRSLVRWMLSLTPAERLQFLEERTREIEAIRERNRVRKTDPGPR